MTVYYFKILIVDLGWLVSVHGLPLKVTPRASDHLG